jgi:hypothetical protein
VTYEERITLWRASDFDHAIALAEAEAREYAADLGHEYSGLAQAYALYDDPRHPGTPPDGRGVGGVVAGR